MYTVYTDKASVKRIKKIIIHFGTPWPCENYEIKTINIRLKLKMAILKIQNCLYCKHRSKVKHVVLSGKIIIKSVRRKGKYSIPSAPSQSYSFGILINVLSQWRDDMIYIIKIYFLILVLYRRRPSRIFANSN